MDRKYTYALLHVKDLNAETRTIAGIASTATPDLHGDILEPKGAHFRNPLPLLFHHDKTAPVGHATLSVEGDEIRFEATLAEVAEPGAVRNRVEEAWQSIKAGLIRAVSIGFMPRPGGMKFRKQGGLHLLQTDIFELSLVTIPANVDATILTVKSLDAPHLAAAERWAFATRTKDRAPMTHKEIIQNFENKRAAIVARMDVLMADANAAGETLSGDQAAEYDRLGLEVKSIDEHLVRARELERLNAAAATPVTSNNSPAVTTRPVVSIRPNVEPGTAFTRIAMATAACKGNKWEAAEYAKQWDDTTPEVSLFLKAAVAPGTTTDAAWAKPLATPGNVILEEFLTLLRPATIIGRIGGMPKVPFLVPVPLVTAGGSYKWVGEAKPKPVTSMAFSSTSLPITKAAGIIVLTEELVRNSTPSAEEVVRREMIRGIASFLDKQFVDPTVAAVAGVNPASVTNGVTPVTATTNPATDIHALLSKFTTAGLPVAGVHLIMSSTNALALAFRKNNDGSAEFPGVSVTGGAISGIPLIVSDHVGDDVVAVLAPYVVYADDGGVTVDVSREASLQMDSAPMSPADATTVYVSLWQTNSVGLRAERFINWVKANPNAAQYIDGAVWTPGL